MKNTKHQLLIEQTEQKLLPFRSLEAIVIPPNGWIHTIRKSLKMSLRQLGIKLSMTAQSVKEMEEREANGTISIKSLNEAARILDMKLVYGFVSKHESLDKMIEKRAQEIAREIVLRTNNSMILEDQQNSENRINKAIEQKTTEIKTEMPKYLWD